MTTNDLTSIEKRGTHYYKHEDELFVNGVCGGKVRVADVLIRRAMAIGINEFVTCGSRDSRQCAVVAKMCEYYGVKSHIFMPSGKETDIVTSIGETNGATIHTTKVGYNSVLIANASKFASDNNFSYIPFGMETQIAIDTNMQQVQNVPKEVKRIVIPCGGGMNMISVIKGLEYYGRYDVKVIGVVVGKKPNKTFDKFLSNTIFEQMHVKWEFVEYPYSYHVKAKKTMIDGVELDEMYEAKCIPFLQDGDLLWIVGKKCY